MFCYWFTSLVVCLLCWLICKQGAWGRLFPSFFTDEVYQRYEWPRGLKGSGYSKWFRRLQGMKVDEGLPDVESRALWPEIRKRYI